MEIVVALAIIGLIVVGSRRKKKAKEQFNNLPEIEKQRIVAANKQKEHEADELVAIILPITRDK